MLRFLGVNVRLSGNCERMVSFICEETRGSDVARCFNQEDAWNHNKGAVGVSFTELLMSLQDLD